MSTGSTRIWRTVFGITLALIVTAGISLSAADTCITGCQGCIIGFYGCTDCTVYDSCTIVGTGCTMRCIRCDGGEIDCEPIIW
jgi:hypothetical protein